jgi:hypothetical protein
MDYPAGYESCPDVDMDGDLIPESEEVHCGGLVWGGALWDLVENMSAGAGAVTQEARDTAYRLVLESHFFLDQEAQFDEAAAAICFADSLLYEGSHGSVIGSTFANRGIDSGACTPSDFPPYVRSGMRRVTSIQSSSAEQDAPVRGAPGPKPLFLGTWLRAADRTCSKCRPQGRGLVSAGRNPRTRAIAVPGVLGADHCATHAG